MCWGFRDCTEKQGTQMEILAGLHKDARNELQAEDTVKPKDR